MSNTNHPFNVWINPDTLMKLNMYATEAILQKNSEVGGFARILEQGNDVFVTDIFIPTQQSTSGTFDVTPEMDNEFMRSKMKEGNRADLPSWKSIVHSHPVGMSPSMSSTDVTAIQRRAEDTECYSLIISASRQCDSTNLLMHYCCKIGGKTLIFNDIPVNVAWDVARRDRADELADAMAKEMGAESKSDLAQMKDAFRDAMCNSLPVLFEKDRIELRKQIAADVKEKVSSRNFGFNSNYSYGVPKGSINRLPAIQPKKNRPSHQSTADMNQMLDKAHRLFAIGYDKVDLESSNPNKIITKEEAKKARRLYRKLVMEMNTELRKYGCAGYGDLVIVKPEALVENPAAIDLTMDPTEVEDFTIKNGMVSYVVGGDLFWSDEIEVMTTYETIMGWDNEKVPA